VVVRDHELDARETTLAQPQQELTPARAALPIGELDRQDAAPAIPADADRQQHRLAADHTGLAHALVAGIDDQIGAGLLEPAVGKLGQTLVEPRVDPRFPI
jgi:hypothetical protein